MGLVGRLAVGLLVAAAGLAGQDGCSRPARESPGSHAPLAPPSSATPVPTAAVSSASPQPALPAAPLCGDAGDVFVFTSPEHPVRGRPLRVVAVSDRSIDAHLTVTGAGTSSSTPERHEGPPYFWMQRIEAPTSGKWTATLTRDEACGGADLATRVVTVRGQSPAIPDSPLTALWPTRAAWSPSFENLYSAWIESMFEAPLDAQVSYSALHDVLRDPARNFLFDHAGAAEDEQGIVIRPDCADLPYFLRAYFAFKLGLPFGWSRCSRGENGTAPTCTEFATSSDPFPPVDGKPQTLPPWADPQRPHGGPWDSNVKRLGELFRTTLADWVQSGAGRTLATDEESDYYPVRLSAETLRPGTIFADPYGHVLVIAQRIPQTATGGGILLAVDGQPDGTVGRKRFWRGNFLFAIDPALGSAGFKRFRPVVRDAATGKLRRLKNAELPTYSAQDRVRRRGRGLLRQDGRRPVAVAARSDDRAPRDGSGAGGAGQDTGDLGRQRTPFSRDRKAGRRDARRSEGSSRRRATGRISRRRRGILRILVADGCGPCAPGSASREGRAGTRCPAGQDGRCGARGASKRGSRESCWSGASSTREPTARRGSLTLRDVIDRQSLAPRWPTIRTTAWSSDGARRRPSPEASTCVARAPPGQVDKMGGYRAWFHERRRPPR